MEKEDRRFIGELILGFLFWAGAGFGIAWCITHDIKTAMVFAVIVPALGTLSRVIFGNK